MEKVKSTQRALPQFPLGFWNYTTLKMTGARAVKDWADCGMTLAMSQEFDPDRDNPRALRAVLDAAHKKRIRVIVCDRRGYAWNSAQPEAFDKFRAGYTAAVKQFGSHPAVFGFHLGDEPQADAFPNLCRAMPFAREAAPHLTPFLNVLPKVEGTPQRVGFAKWSDYLDALCTQARVPLLCYDHYAQLDENALEQGIEQYFDNLREFRDASERHGVPFWTTLLSAGHYTFRCPTEDDFRWQLHTAVAHGATGILWFFLYMRTPHSNYRIPPIDEHWERTETFGWLSRVQRTFLKWQAPVLQRLRVKRIAHTGKAYGGHELFAGTEHVAEFNSAAPHIITEWQDDAGRAYVSVVNNSQRQPAFVQMRFCGRDTKVFRVDWLAVEQPHACRQRETTVSTWMHTAPGQMELFRVQP
jgi:hypothetical protein